jgi:hypothetical protein
MDETAPKPIAGSEREHLDGHEGPKHGEPLFGWVELYGQRLERRGEKGNDGQQRERGQHAGDQGPEQSHRDAARVELSGPAPVEPKLEAGALESREEGHAVAKVVAQHVRKRVGTIAEGGEGTEQRVGTRATA